jgi:glycosyltransferase involved in cell wall biosynthesis
MADANARAGAPLISLVLPVYNGARYLSAALDSIFAQRFADFELIAVDDCSTDATPAILADYAARHPNMRVLTNPANSKLPASLNNGFRAARGKWFSWTSDDNLLHPDTLEQLAAEATAGPDADILYADFQVIDEHGALIRKEAVEPAGNLIFGNSIGCCFLYRREVDAALGGYDESLFGVEDYDFWLRAAAHGFRYRPVHRELYSYRRHGESLTDKRARQIHALTAQVMLREIDKLPPSPLRAEALVRLACRDPYTLRWNLLVRALHDRPASVPGHWRDILRWLKYALWARRA